MRNLPLKHPRATWLIALSIGLIAAASALILQAINGSAGRPAALVSAMPPPRATGFGAAYPFAPDAASNGTAGISTRLRATHDPQPTAAPSDAAAISALTASGIPATALNAYRVAAARLDHVDPGCGIDWALLAGIGREESDHGQSGGAVLHTDGLSTPKIIGPALDGDGNQYIPAPPDGVALDGDAKYTHALGPMQFIPQTWAVYGADANGDGVADIFNINDAALGAARYLCAAGGDLATPAGQQRAVFAYNHSGRYVAQVLALAAAYRHGIAIVGQPVGNVTGHLKPVPHKATPPPADPGQPIGVSNGSKTKPATSSKKPSTSSSPSTTPTASASTPAPAATPAPAPPSHSSPASRGPSLGLFPSPVAPTPAPSTPTNNTPRASSSAPGSPASTSPTCQTELLGQCLGAY